MYFMDGQCTTNRGRQLKKYRKLVTQINKLEELYTNKSDEELRNMTEIFKKRLAGNRG